MSRSKRYLKLWWIPLCLWLGLTACTVSSAQPAATLTPEVFIALTRAVPLPQNEASISGRVLWGSAPVPNARVELRTGAWAANIEDPVAVAIADANGEYVLESVPAGDYGLVALWTDGGFNMAPVTPVQVAEGVELTGMDVYLAQELELLEPISGAEVETTPTLRWSGLPGAAAYTLWIIDAGTTELVFDLIITETSQVMQLIAPPLTPGETYQWGVNGWEKDNADTSASNLLASLTSEFKVRTPDASTQPNSACATAFDRRELHEPYQRHSGQARYTLSTEELTAYLGAMGIAELCIPPEFGAPFINVDWDSAQQPGTTGRMVSLGFEDLYTGAGWSRAFILYSTYNFATGSDYDTFANIEDRDSVQSGTMAGTIEVNGMKGFVRFKPSNFSFGTRTLYKSLVFPGESAYVAVVYAVDDYEADTDWDALIQDLTRGAYPPELQATVALVDSLAMSLQFQALQLQAER